MSSSSARSYLTILIMRRTAEIKELVVRAKIIDFSS
jgi:hypothetical protein